MENQDNLVDVEYTELPQVPLKQDPAKAKKKRKGTNEEELIGWAFSIIPLVGFAIFGLVPLAMSFYVAFNQFPGLGLVSDYSDDMFPYIVKFVGFGNFGAAFRDAEFWRSILNTLFVVFTTVFSLALSVFISMMLYHCKRGKKLYQTVFFIPYVCSLVAITFMWKWVFDNNAGIINSMLWQLGIYKNQLDVINWIYKSPDSYRFVMFVVLVWSGTGFNIILLSAAMTNINKSCYEAAELDGAGMMTKFFKITLPAISPTLFYLLVTGVIGALQEFTRFQVMDGTGGPKNVGVTIVFYLYQRIMPNNMDGVGHLDIGVATAVGWFLALLIGLVTFANFKISKKWVSYDD